MGWESKWRWNVWDASMEGGPFRLSAKLLDGSPYYLTNFFTDVVLCTVYDPSFVSPYGIPLLLVLPEYTYPGNVPFPYGYPVEPDARHW